MSTRRNAPRAHLRVEELESRELPSVYTVTSAADNIAHDGAVTLREAILAAETRKNVGDALAGDGKATIIRFNIHGSGLHTIQLRSALPALTERITIDGSSQPGFSGSPLIELDGSHAGARTNGLTLTGDSNNVRGLLIDHFHGNGISITSNHNSITGDYIGLDHSGFFAAGNGGDGIQITGSHNTIGGTRVSDRVVVSGSSGAAIDLSGSHANHNSILGDYIGTDADGFAAVANANGIVIRSGANHNQIGGTLHGARNVISGNLHDQVVITGNGSSANVLQGNYIGPDSSGDAAALSGRDGIRLEAGASGNQIGGTTSESGNLIGGAGHIDFETGKRIGVGIEIVGSTTSNNVIQGNWIGLNAAGLAPLDNLAGGIILRAAGHNIVGGSSKAARNMIADQTNTAGLGGNNQILPANWIVNSIQFLLHPGLRSGSFRE